ASGDKFLCESIIDGYDIHGDWARKLANLHPPVVGGASFLTDKIALKKFRTAVKNEFVFPLFYGAGRETISLATGIPFYKIDNATYDFWNMFPDVLGWQEDLKKFYEENGYVETLTGFRCRGPLQHNQIINYPIQGTASDIVVDTMVRLSKIANEEGLSSLRPVLNIHDDLTFFIPQTDLDEYLELIIPTMLFPDFDFVNLPLSVEVSVGSNWGNLEELGTYTSDEWTNS
ncbi:hypothetical protein CL634_09365, partial [bacterium]|nr:hypothetical protein [bacterium]